MKKLHNYINGDLTEPISGKYLDNYDPSRGIVYAQIPDSDATDVELAVEAAKKAFPSWASMAAQKRSNYLLAIAEKIEEKEAMLAKAESVDNGKPLWLAKSVDIPRAASNFKFYATAATHDHSNCYEMGDFALNYTSNR